MPCLRYELLLNVSLQSVPGMLFEFTFLSFWRDEEYSSVILKGAESSVSPEQERQLGKLMFSTRE